MTTNTADTTSAVTPSRSTAIADALQKIERELAALPDIGDIRTSNEEAAYHATRSRLWGARQQIQLSARELTEVEPQIVAETEWLDNLTGWRKTLDAELLAMPPRIRNEKELGRQQNLTLSIRVIDFGRRVVDDTGYGLETLRLGQLMREAGYVQAPPQPNTNQVYGQLPWFGALRDVRQRLKELEPRCVDAQHRLDTAIHDVMMTDEERARAWADHLKRTAELNARPQRKHGMDGTVYDKYPDGRIVEVTS